METKKPRFVGAASIVHRADDDGSNITNRPLRQAKRPKLHLVFTTKRQVVQ
tara:strand:+ start:675 stop:827 length:153 start_codon:yes stop_codon:yes gene_type:complete